MTSKEIVQRTIEYGYPERVAITFHDSDTRDIACKAQTKATEWREVGGGHWERFDEWGNLWGRVDPTSKGEVIRGVLDDLDAIDAYEFPDYSRNEIYADMVKARQQAADKWLNGCLPGFAFNIARNMRKLDRYLMDLLLEADRMHVLHDRIDAMLADMIRNYAASGADGIMLWEDWGTQERTLISPALWEEEFAPRFRKLCGLAHRLGLKVFMHSCGRIGAIVPGLIAAGVDVLQFDQPDLHGIDELAAYQESARITFWCPVDIQQTLQLRNESVIRAKAREMIEKLWRGRGGFIAGYYCDNASIGLDPQWQGYGCDEFLKIGKASNFTRTV